MNGPWRWAVDVDIETLEDAVAVLSEGRWMVEYRPSDPENGWTGAEPEYLPFTVTVVRYGVQGEELPEEDWLRYAGADLERTLVWAAREVAGGPEVPSERELG